MFTVIFQIKSAKFINNLGCAMSVAGMKFNVLAQIMVDHNAMNFPKAINFGLCLLTL